MVLIKDVVRHSRYTIRDVLPSYVTDLYFRGYPSNIPIELKAKRATRVTNIQRMRNFLFLMTQSGDCSEYSFLLSLIILLTKYKA